MEKSALPHGNMDTVQKTSLFKPHIIELKHHVEADLANFTPVATRVKANPENADQASL